jgi:hypothetical protein
MCLHGIHSNGVGQEPSSDTIDKPNYYRCELIPKKCIANMLAFE